MKNTRAQHLTPKHVRHDHKINIILCVLAGVLPFVFLPGCSDKKASERNVSAARACDTITLGFYNVENLFDLNYDSTEYAEYRPGALGWNKQTWEKKVSNIAAVIAALDADVIGLCEVENRNALEDLRKELDKRGAAYRYAAVAGPPGRGATRAALLSRLPVIASCSFGGVTGGAGRRDILETDLDCGGTALKLFVNHWPSKKHPESLRLAAARALAERIKKLPSQTDYVIIGDLNADFDEWRKLRTERLDDTKGTTGINHVLKTVHGEPGKFISYVTREEMAFAESAWHFDVWLELPEERRWSYTYQGQPKTPDHFLLPQSLFDPAGWSYLDRSFSVFTWDGKLLENGEPFRWQMRGFGKRRFHTGEGFSDHLPLCAVFIKKKFASVQDSAAATRAVPVSAQKSAVNKGFEKSMEGWLAGARGVSAARDSGRCAAGRCSLRIQGAAQEKNICAARTILRRDATNRERRENIVFDLRGSGKISVRARAGKGRWRYYNAPAFSPSGSARYLPVRHVSWRHIELPFIYDNTSSTDLAVEIRAGKGAAFCFWIDNVGVR